MKKIVWLAFVLMLSSIAIVEIFTKSTVARSNQSNRFYSEGKFVFAGSKTILVPDNFTSIQEAVNNASDGYTIFVRAETYCENVVLNKPNLTLIGENKRTTIIDGNGKTVVSLKANNTKIEGFTVQNGSFGILMNPWTHGHIISNNIIVNNDYGISGHYDCVDISIHNNTIISNNVAGIVMLFSHSAISSNLISDNGKDEFQKYGVGIQIVVGVNSETIYCVNNTIFSNTIKNHQTGIWALRYSKENLFYHNNFLNNKKQFSAPATTWNNSVMKNYWSDYNGTDFYGGPYQNDTGSDGIGDMPYVICEMNQDSYPIMGIFSDFSVIHQKETYHITAVCNSTISAFEFDQVDKVIMFSVTGPSATTGFCRVCVPYDLMEPPYTVIIDDGQTEVLYFNDNLCDNGTHRWIYFTYRHSTHEVDIIPEFPIWTSIPLTLIVLTVAMACAKKRGGSLSSE